MTKTAARAVLFDVDGTLIDSTYLHALAWWRALRRSKIDVAMWRLHRTIGIGADQLVPQVMDKAPGHGSEALAQSNDAIQSSFWPSPRTTLGARELVRRCHQAGLLTVLASSSAERELDLVQR